MYYLLYFNFVFGAYRDTEGCLNCISLTTKAVVARMCSVKKVLLEISQNSQENICARIFF